MTDEKKYLIHFETQYRTQVLERLAPYKPHVFKLLPYCAITTTDKKQAASLLEALATLPGVTYREALERKTQE